MLEISSQLILITPVHVLITEILAIATHILVTPILLTHTLITHTLATHILVFITDIGTYN